MKKIISTITLAFVVAICNAQDGTLDLSFDADGIVTTPIGTANDFGNTVVIQSDGKIVMAGNSGNNLALARYNTNGSLDNTFGTGGTVTTNLGCANASGSSFAIQSDGKIVVGGYCGIFPNYDFALTRYNMNGTLDNTFGNSGIVITPILSAGDQGMAVAIQNDGKILLGGSTDNGSNGDLALARYNTNGSLDVTFDTDGIVTTATGKANDIIRAVAIQSDGRIVVAGYSYTSKSYSYDFIIARYNSNGSLDNTFGTGGILTTAIIHNTNDYAESIAIQTDGKIIVGGYSFTGLLLLARYNTNGTLDITFGSGGTLSIAFGCAYQNDYSVALQSDGKILLGGYSNLNNANADFALARFNSNGTLDNTFGVSGIVTTPIGNGADIATSLAIQSDGKIVLAGRTHNGTNYDFALVRYNNTITTTINTLANQILEIKMYPNSFSTQTTFETNQFFNDANLNVYDIYGIQVKQLINISGQQFILQREHLPSGLYFFYLTQNHKTIASDKLMITD